MEVLPSEQSPQAKDTRKREREDNSSGSRVTKRVRKANSRYQEYEVPKAQKGSAEGNGENATPTPKTPKSRVTTTPSKEGGGKRIEFAVTSGKKKIEIAVTPRKNGGVQNGAPATPTTPSTPATPSQPQSGRAKRSKAMRRQKSDFYRGGRSTELSPPLKHCQKILTKLMSHNCAWPFNKPVDPISLNIPDYFDIIKFPMDLGTIQEQLGNGFYDNVEDFANDVRLVWRNAYTYNKAGSDVCIMATELSTVFEGEFKKVDPEEQVPEPAPVTPAPASRKRTPNSRAKASPVGGVVTPAKTPVSKAKPAPKPKTPKKEEAVVKPKGSTKRVEEEKKSSSAQKKRTQSKPSAEDSQTRQLQRELQRMRKKMDGLQQQIQCVTANPKPAQKKRQQPAVRQMNRDEKRRLSEKINSLPGKYLGEVVRIIQESISIRDDDAPPPEEIEIDMDALGNSTLRKLESFVDECLSKKKNPIVPVSQPVEGAQQEQNGAVDDPMGVQSDEESDTDSDSYTESEEEEEDSQPPVQSGLPASSSTPSHTPPHPSPVTPVATPTPVSSPVVPATTPTAPSPTVSPGAPQGLSVSSVLPISNGQKTQQPSKLSSSGSTTPMKKSSGSLSFLESLNSLKSLGSSKGSPLGSSQSISSPTINSPTPTTPSDPPKSEEKVVINEKGWSQLNGEDKKEGKEKVESQNGDGSLWSEFREKDQQKQQKEKELKDKEEEERKAWIAQQEQLRKEEEARQREREEAEQQRIKDEEEAAQREREQLRQQEKLEREKKAADAALQNEHGLMMREFETGVDGFAT